MRRTVSNSSLVTRLRRMADHKNSPRRKSNVGSDRTARAKARERTDRLATANCSAASSVSATTPSARATERDNRIVARVEPIATVTTRSKAFSLASVRLPVSRSRRTR